MAKAGFWLRGARGKLAGASAQKGQNGTILREIVKPRNPKTDKQTYQRAIMATVMKAYSAGKEIFDHAFQGVEKGQKSQQYFIARNATLLRSNIAQEINAIAAGTLQPTAAIHAAVAPKALYAVPGAYMVSEGTYEQSFFEVASDSIGAPAIAINEGEMETVAQYAQRNGLVPGDIYTVVAIAAQPTVVFNGVDATGQISDSPKTKQYAAKFAYVRIQVKSDVLTNTAEASTGGTAPKMANLFEVTGLSNPDAIFPTWVEDELESSVEIINGGLGQNMSYTIIRSRLDEDLRSTSYMTISEPGTPDGYGITSPYILPTWKKGTDALGTSELILESDN